MYLFSPAGTARTANATGRLARPERGSVPDHVREPVGKTDDACSRHPFHCINLLSLELWGRNIPFFSNGLANQSQAGPSYGEPPTKLKVMVGVKASNGNHGRSCGPSRGPAGGDGSTR